MRHARILLSFMVIFPVSTLITCKSQQITPGFFFPDSGYIDPANTIVYEVTGDPAGHFDLSNLTVFGFSQVFNSMEDTQVYALKPDVNMRAWAKWDTGGTKKDDYFQNYIIQCHERNILFIGGGTMSVLFADEAPNHEQFLDWATRDAKGGLVLHAYITQGAYRGSLANPSYRQYLVSYLKVQIDLGVDGLFLDELNGGGYSGGKEWNWNGNEGYDDYFIRDFNRYLMQKYPDYTGKDWSEHFKMTPDNYIRRDVPYNDLTNNFNYRKYLARKSWTANPRTAHNPLSAEWGSITANRFDVHDTSFAGKYMGLYIKEIIVELRKYAREKYSKEILITANGIFPWMDFNSLGLYEYNPDDTGRGADYVPVASGHLNGTKSLKSIYQKILLKSRDISGDAPLVMFMDWPCAMINGYYKLPLSEKKDFWQIYAAEAYACGLHFAFHLRTTMPGEPTAAESGVLTFLSEYSQFYKQNSGLYHGTVNAENAVSISKPNITWNLIYQQDQNRYLLHLINHNYKEQILPQSNFTVSIDIVQNPADITMVTPDGPNERCDYTRSGDALVVTVKSLEFYDILLINYTN